MKKVRIGVVGIGRGTSMMNYCREFGNAELVAVCDNWEKGLLKKKEELDDNRITYYTDYSEFLNHPMDAVVLANYATEHAPFAIQAMNCGKHVISEVLPVQTMKEAVELVECVEKTGKIYAYAENYCYMPATREMRKLFREGTLGEFEYGEGEYIHNCSPFWIDITYGERDHWRNNMYATFYCTHSIGPLIHITGLKPIKVTGFELPFNERMANTGRRCGSTGIEMITLENGAVIKSVHGELVRNSIWYTIYGSKGRAESAREDAQSGDTNKIYVSLNDHSPEITAYEPISADDADKFGHSGSDYYTMWNFVEKILGNPDTDTIDVYEALDMFLPGLFAYRSILQGGISMNIPDLRNKAIRDKFRTDTSCTDPKVAGDQLIPCYSKGNPEIPDQIYERQREIWLKSQKDN